MRAGRGPGGQKTVAARQPGSGATVLRCAVINELRRSEETRRSRRRHSRVIFTIAASTNTTCASSFTEASRSRFPGCEATTASTTRRCSLISSSAVSVYLGADLTILRATWRFNLLVGTSHGRRDGKSREREKKMGRQMRKKKSADSLEGDKM